MSQTKQRIETIDTQAGSAVKRPVMAATMKAQVENHTMPLDMLCRSEQNVRTRGSDEADEIVQLAELIYSFGLINPLSIVDNTQGDDHRVPVAAGDRRFRALTLLAAQGRIRPDEPVDVRRFESADTLGLSLAENSGRLEMHPVDQYEAFRKLVEVEGKSLEAVADMHGVSALTVRRRMTLSKVAPELLALYRDNEISQDQLQVLALVEDHSTQVHVWRSAPSYNRTPYSLRSMVLAAEVSADDHRVQLVGVEVYEAAGGEIRRDLFSDSDSTYLKDALLLDRLYAEKLEAIQADFLAEGWAWAEKVGDLYGLHSFHRTRPTLREATANEAMQDAAYESRIGELEAIIEQIGIEADQDEDNNGSLYARQQAAEQEIEALCDKRDALTESRKVFTAAARAISGVRFCATSGVVRHEAGLIRHEDFLSQRNVAADAINAGVGNEREDEQDQDDGHATLSGVEVSLSRYASLSTNGTHTTPTKEKAEYSEKVISDLSAHRTGAIQAAMLDNQRVALASLAWALLDSSERGDYRATSPAAIRGDNQGRTLLEKATAFASSRAGLALSNAEARMHVALGLNQEDRALQSSVYTRLLALDLDSLLEILTYLTARTVNVIGPRSKSFSPADELAEALNLDMADFWTAGNANFFVHVPKAKAVEAVTQARNPKDAESLAKMKKGDAASAAETLLTNTRWLPMPLRSFYRPKSPNKD